MSPKKNGRSLSAHERALWNKVVEKTTPISRAERDVSKPLITGQANEKPSQSHQPWIPKDLRVGSRSEPMHEIRDVAPPVENALARRQSPLGKKALGRMRRGKVSPEARLDLHGMLADGARRTLTGFIFRSAAQGKSLVLVITGKGRDRDEGGPIPMRIGVLRHEVPNWLTSPPLADLVLDLAPAHQKHGGGGAYYVYLRNPHGNRARAR